MPKLTWEFSEPDEDLILEIHSDIAPSKVSASVATSDTRDFRQAKWQAMPCDGNAN